MQWVKAKDYKQATNCELCLVRQQANEDTHYFYIARYDADLSSWHDESGCQLTINDETDWVCVIVHPEDAQSIDATFDDFNRHCQIFMTLVTHCNGMAWKRENLFSAIKSYVAHVRDGVHVEILRGCIAAMQPTGYELRVVEKAWEMQDEMMKAVRGV